MYSNNVVNFQESTLILNAHTKKGLETYRMHLVFLLKRASVSYVMIEMSHLIS